MSMTVIEAAERLNVSHQRIYKLIGRDVLTLTPGTGPAKVTAASVEAYAAERDGPPDGWLRLSDAATRVGCDVSTIRNWIATGRLNAEARRTGAVVFAADLDTLEPPPRGRPPGVRA